MTDENTYFVVVPVLAEMVVRDIESEPSEHLIGDFHPVILHSDESSTARNVARTNRFAFVGVETLASRNG